MPDPLKVDVAYTMDGCWVAEIAPDYDEPFEQDRLLTLVESIRSARPDDDLIFIVDAETLQRHSAAIDEFRDAAKISGTRVLKTSTPFGSAVGRA